MTVTDVSLSQESRDRYLTYALSVVSGRALPDVRDGLKPVQRRILFAMLHNLNLKPENSHRKSAAVVGEVLARFHPHGDTACYEAMVRMAQTFSLRYPLVDGQGNFGSMDGDNAAAYRYTEAKLMPLALEVIGEIDEETVPFRDNFDSTVVEPVVLPSRLPNLLMNGATGIAVGMATSIPPHNLRDVVKALIELSKDTELTNSRLTTLVKAPDFPTGCAILNTQKELVELYTTGRGGIRMRGEWEVEEQARGKKVIVITSVPYAINKATLVERIANLIIERKVPQLTDVRDESTDVVRVVLELAPNADAEVAVAYLLKNTPLESNFAVNLTALVPDESGACVPKLLSLKECLQHFLDFRNVVVERKLQFEKRQLLARLHILEGLVLIYDELDEAIRIVRKSDGRSDAAAKLMQRFKLTEIQSFAVVDMRIYQLSRTNIEEIRAEFAEKEKRVKQIDRILKNPEEIMNIVRADLEMLAEKFGDKRRSKLIKDDIEIEFNEADYVVQDDVHAIITADGWMKRIRQSNDIASTRIREGDSILASHGLSTVDSVLIVTNMGSMFSLKVADFPPSSGYGEPVQKMLKFRDGERIVKTFGMLSSERKSEEPVTSEVIKEGDSVILLSQQGMGFLCTLTEMDGLKRSGKRIMKLREGDSLACITAPNTFFVMATRDGLALAVERKEIVEREAAAMGVGLMSVKPGDKIVSAVAVPKLSGKFTVTYATGTVKEISLTEITKAHRGAKGSKLPGRGEITKIATI